MGAAVDRLFQARERRRTARHLRRLRRGRRHLHRAAARSSGRSAGRSNYYLPHRMDEGYGLSQDGVENCLKKFPATLLLAVDCGSTAVETIAWLRERAWM